MKKVSALILITGLFIIYSRVKAQEITHPQTLLNILAEERIFDAVDYYNQYKDSIEIYEATQCFYDFCYDSYFNNPDSAVVYLERMVYEFPYFFANEQVWFHFLNVIADFYAEIQNYDKLSETYVHVEKYILENDLMTDSIKEQLLEQLVGAKISLEEKKQIPKIEIVSTSSDTSYINIGDEPFFLFKAQYNGVELNTSLDTGTQFYLWLSKDVADRCNMKRIYINDTITILNGKKIRTEQVLVDSINIGSITLLNIPALVMHDSFTADMPDSIEGKPNAKVKVDSVFSSMEVIMGLPLLKKMGGFEWDWHKKTVCFFTREMIVHSIQKPNMYIQNNMILLKLNINGLDLTQL